jgi:hypothetical protein
MMCKNSSFFVVAEWDKLMMGVINDAVAATDPAI